MIVSTYANVIMTRMLVLRLVKYASVATTMILTGMAVVNVQPPAVVTPQRRVVAAPASVCILSVQEDAT